MCLAGLLEAARNAACPDDLAKHNCLGVSVSNWGNEWRFAGKEGESRVPVQGSFRSNNAEMLRTIALQNVAMIPSWAVADELRSGALKRVLLAWNLSASAIYAVYPGNRLMSMKVKAFVDHLARSFGHSPYWDLED